MTDRNRFGIIQITELVYEDFWASAKGFTPYLIMHNRGDKLYSIYCTHPMFDYLEETEAAPLYLCHFRRDKDNMLDIKVERIKK